jgi:hypothetical protein
MSLTKKDLEDLVKGYKVDLANINTKLDTLLSENAALKKLVADRDQEIEGLKLHVNELEQHNRSWSVRILGLPLTTTEEKSSLLVREKVYETVIRPILEGAVQEGDLQQVPPKANDVIEMAHPLRAKDGAIKPIIVRFFARETRALIFRYKKASRLTALPKAVTVTPSSRTSPPPPSPRCGPWLRMTVWLPAGQRTAKFATGWSTTPPSGGSPTSWPRWKKFWASFFTTVFRSLIQ